MSGGLSLDQLKARFDQVMDGAASPEETRAFLEGTIPLMDNPQAIAIGAAALRSRMIPVVAPPGAIDVCGTGGDGVHTLNVSTAVAFVVAGAGVPVAKHGNRAMSSRSGAADVLEALGVGLVADPALLSRCLAEARVAFLFAQNHHAAMRHVAEARKAIGQRTIFNLLGPLSNPAGVRRQLVGVFAPRWLSAMAEALRLLDAEGAWVVHGDGVDELVLHAPSEAAILAEGRIEERRLDVADACALPVAASRDGLKGGSPEENAAELRALLAGAGRPNYRDTVVANAAAALVVAGRAASLREGAALAADSLAAGAASLALSAFVDLTRSAA